MGQGKWRKGNEVALKFLPVLQGHPSLAAELEVVSAPGLGKFPRVTSLSLTPLSRTISFPLPQFSQPSFLSHIPPSPPRSQGRIPLAGVSKPAQKNPGMACFSRGIYCQWAPGCLATQLRSGAWHSGAHGNPSLAPFSGPSTATRHPQGPPAWAGASDTHHSPSAWTGSGGACGRCALHTQQKRSRVRNLQGPATTAAPATTALTPCGGETITVDSVWRPHPPHRCRPV